MSPTRAMMYAYSALSFLVLENLIFECAYYRNYHQMHLWKIIAQIAQVKGGEVLTHDDKPVAYASSPEELVCDSCLSTDILYKICNLLRTIFQAAIQV